MATFPIAFRVAQVVGLTGTAWLSGNIAVYSMAAAPCLLHGQKEGQLSPTQTAKLWRSLYNYGKSQNPPIAALSASALFYLAWSVRPGASLHRLVRPNSSALYSAAAVLALSIVPFTLIGMAKTNTALSVKAEAKSADVSDAGEAVEVENLVRKWISLNAVRSLLPLAGSLVGVFAALV